MQQPKQTMETKETTDFYRKYTLGNPPEHNHLACAAILEYEKLYDKFDSLNYEQLPNKRGGTINGRRLHDFIIGSPPSMQKIAEKYGTTVEDMRCHRRCLPKEYGY